MRLSQAQIRQIKHAVQQCFGPHSRVYLFGSRTDDSRRGGDIDLLIQTDLAGEAAFEAEQRLYARLQRTLGERRIDLITQSHGQRPGSIHLEALRQGIEL